MAASIHSRIYEFATTALIHIFAFPYAAVIYLSLRLSLYIYIYIYARFSFSQFITYHVTFAVVVGMWVVLRWNWWRKQVGSCPNCTLHWHQHRLSLNHVLLNYCIYSSPVLDRIHFKLQLARILVSVMPQKFWRARINLILPSFAKLTHAL